MLITQRVQQSLLNKIPNQTQLKQHPLYIDSNHVVKPVALLKKELLSSQNMHSRTSLINIPSTPHDLINNSS